MVITAGRYFAALDRYGGSPARPLGEVRAAGPDLRRHFDEALVGAEGLAFAPATGAPAAPAPAVTSGDARAGGACLITTGAPVAIELPRGGTILQPPAAGPATVRLARLGEADAGAPALTAAAGARSELRLPGDRMRDPWRATVEGPPGTRVCGLGA